VAAEELQGTRRGSTPMTTETVHPAAETKSERKGRKLLRMALAAAALLVGASQLVRFVNAFIPDGGKPSAPFTVENVTLTTAHAQDIGKFTARESNVIRTGTGFYIYFEPRNLATTHTGEEINSTISVDVLIQNAAGTAVVGQDRAWQLPFQTKSTQHRSISRAWSSLEVPALNLADGKYTMTLRIHDEVARVHVDRKIEIEYNQNAAVANLPANPVR